LQQKDEFWRYCVVYGKILFQVEGGSVVFGMSGRLNTDGIPQLGYQRTEEEVGYKVMGLINFEDGWPFFWHKGYEREEYITPEGVRFTTSVLIWGIAVYFSTSAPGGLAKVIGGILSLPSGYAADQLWMDMMDLEERDVKVFVGPCYLNFQQQFPYGDWQVEEWK